MKYRIFAFFDIEVGHADSEKMAIAAAKKFVNESNPETFKNNMNYSVREVSDDKAAENLNHSFFVNKEDLKNHEDTH